MLQIYFINLFRNMQCYSIIAQFNYEHYGISLLVFLTCFTYFWDCGEDNLIENHCMFLRFYDRCGVRRSCDCCHIIKRHAKFALCCHFLKKLFCHLYKNPTGTWHVQNLTRCLSWRGRFDTKLALKMKLTLRWERLD